MRASYDKILLRTFERYRLITLVVGIPEIFDMVSKESNRELLVFVASKPCPNGDNGRYVNWLARRSSEQ